MKKSTLCLVTCLLALGLAAAAPAQAANFGCYQESNLRFFGQVVEIADSGVDKERGCWFVQLRLLGRTSPRGHAMICGGTACEPSYQPSDGIYWWKFSPVNENIKSVSVMQNRDCDDVTFWIVPNDVSETMLIHFIAFFEEGYFLPPRPTLRPRWGDGVIDLSSVDGSKSHCQDGDPRGAVCLDF